MPVTKGIGYTIWKVLYPFATGDLAWDAHAVTRVLTPIIAQELDESSPLSEVLTPLLAGKKIQAIKVLREKTSTSLIDAKRTVEILDAFLRPDSVDRCAFCSQPLLGTNQVQHCNSCDRLICDKCARRPDGDNLNRLLCQDCDR
jgi:hypothetical protein